MDAEARFVKIESTLEAVQQTLAQMADVMTEQAKSNEQIKTLFRMVEDDRLDIKSLETTTSEIKEQCAKNHGRPDPDHDKVVENSQVSTIIIRLLVGTGLLVAGIMLGKGG